MGKKSLDYTYLITFSYEVKHIFRVVINENKSILIKEIEVFIIHILMYTFLHN